MSISIINAKLRGHWLCLYGFIIVHQRLGITGMVVLLQFEVHISPHNNHYKY